MRDIERRLANLEAAAPAPCRYTAEQIKAMNGDEFMDAIARGDIPSPWGCYEEMLDELFPGGREHE